MLLKRSLTAGLILFAASALAESGEPGTGSIGFHLGYYDQPDDGGTDGNPFLDEELTVVEPVVVYDYQLTAEDALWAIFSYDHVSSASIDRLSNFPAQSGASGDYYYGLDVGWKKQLDESTVRGLFVSGSVEYDYVSFGLGSDYTVEDPETGAGFKLAGNAFFDNIDVIRFDGSEDEGSETKLTLSGTASRYQPISPLLHATYGTTLTFQDGFLETAYNAVVIEDGSGPNPNLVNNAPGREVAEELPDTRIRGALFGSLKRTVGQDGAFELGGRLYADDWGIVSFTLEPRYEHWLVPDEHRLRVSYRFYSQTEADAFGERFTQEPSERTQDSDLGDFNANSLGARWIWTLSERDEFLFGGEYTLRSDDLNYITINTGYTRSF